jgi:hypothetical protein
MYIQYVEMSMLLMSVLPPALLALGRYLGALSKPSIYVSILGCDLVIHKRCFDKTLPVCKKAEDVSMS